MTQPIAFEKPYSVEHNSTNALDIIDRNGKNVCWIYAEEELSNEDHTAAGIVAALNDYDPDDDIRHRMIEYLRKINTHNLQCVVDHNTILERETASLLAELEQGGSSFDPTKIVGRIFVGKDLKPYRITHHSVDLDRWCPQITLWMSDIEEKADRIGQPKLC